MTPRDLAITEYRPMNRRQLQDLRGYVSFSTMVGGVLLFLVGIGIVGGGSWLIARAVPLLRDGAWWLLGPCTFSLCVFGALRKWGGGRDFRPRVREDISGGVAAVRRVSALDAIEVEEAEDEGPAFFLLTADGKTLYVSFQELARYKRRGFPWTEFEIVEAPHSGIFFSIKNTGDRLTPSLVRPPFSWKEVKALGCFNRHYHVLDLDFAELKRRSGRIEAG